MQPTLLFYDIESTGINKCFDQVLQFAAIRTDVQLNELSRHQFFVRLSPDVIPSAMASLTHHISLSKAATGVSELSAIASIHALLNEPGTISLGYNTLTFDDEFLRFSFYRHLLPPYTHQYANQCSRMDLYPMALFYFLYKPEVITWPTIDGRPSMKLEKLSAANALATGPAHDAMVDVEATLALAKAFYREQPMWAYLTGYFNKVVEKKRLAALPVALESAYGVHREGLMILGRFGSRQQYCAPVLDLGAHRHYKNQHIWLRLDLPELQQVDAALETIKANTWVMHKKGAEPGFLVTNTARYNQALSDERKAIVAENLAFLKANPNIFSAMIDYHLDDTYPVLPGVDPQAALYQSAFWTPKEAALCQQFHDGDVHTKCRLLTQFTNPDLQTMAIRLIGRYEPQALTGKWLHQYQDDLQQVFSPDSQALALDFKGQPRYGVGQLDTDIRACRQSMTLSDAEQALLTELSAWLQQKQTSSA